jgi:hypothetical protein
MEYDNFEDPYHPSLKITSSDDSRLASARTEPEKSHDETPPPKAEDLPKYVLPDSLKSCLMAQNSHFFHRN